MSSEEVLIEIKVYDGDKVIAQTTLDQNKIVIGRILSADFRIPDRRVSRIHALIERFDDGQMRLTDLASSHGTFVNGKRVVESIISPQDELKFGTLDAKLKLINAPVSVDGAQDNVATMEVEKGAVKQAKEASKVEAMPVAMDPMGQAHVKSPSEATVIRSLKQTARTRGVMEPGGLSEEVEVTVYWEDTILAVDHFKKSKQVVTIGEDHTNDYVIPAQTLPAKYEFLKIGNKSVTILMNPVIEGSARIDGKMQNFKDFHKAGLSTITLTGHDIAKVRIGSVHFFIMLVPEPPTIPMAPIFDQGKLFWSLLFSLALVGVLIVTIGMLVGETIEGDVKEIPDRYRRIIVKNIEKKIESTQKAGTDSKTTKTVTKTGGNAGEGAKDKGTEGKRGKKKEPKKTGITNRPKVAKVKKTVDAPKKAKNKAPVKAPKLSLLESLKKSGIGKKITKVANSGGAAGKDPLDKALQGVGGGKNNAGGAGGSGLKNVGTGGGGTAENIGGTGAKGFAGGGKGTGKGSIPGKGKFIVGVESSGVTVLGGLSREEVRRVVMAHKSEIDFCYRQALSKNPTLFGTIKSKWTIKAPGKVSTIVAASNSTGSISLANCINAKIKTWKFPSPRGNASADVDWPWTFKPIK